MTRSHFAILLLSIPTFCFGGELAKDIPINLTQTGRKTIVANAPVDHLTDGMSVRIQRPTTLNGLLWDANSSMKVTLGYVVDGTTYPCRGQVSGGIRISKGVEVPEYRFYCGTIRHYDRDQDQIKRIGEGKQTSAFVELELLRGTIVTNILQVQTSSSTLPEREVHHSVTFDAENEGIEESGDGVIDVAITVGSNSDRALFVGVATRDGAAAGAVTVDGTGETVTEIYTQEDLSVTLMSHYGYEVVAPEAGARTVNSDLTDTTTTDHFVGVVSFYGVNQSDATGTPVESGFGFLAQTSVACTDAGDDDLIIEMSSIQPTPTIGADQDLRNTITTSFPTNYRTSTQDGAVAGDVMSWTYAGDGSRGMACVAFKAVTTTLDQEGFAFGDDDGNEAGHTLGTQDTDHSGNLGVKTLRVVVDSSGTATSSPTPTLRYQLNGSGGYALVPTTSSVTGVTGIIETGDATNSGNNTASAAWAISTPAASAGDLILINLGWDDSTTTTDVTMSNGKNGESPSVIAGPIASGGTAVRAKAWSFVATGAWTAGTIISTPTASEQWTATVIKIPAGEFDPATPIGVTGSSVSAAGGNPGTAAMVAGSGDENGRVVDWVVGDVDDPDGSITGWVEIASVDRGAVGANFMSRSSTVTASESIAAQTGLTFPSADNWCTIGYIVRPPDDVTNQVYISASANVTAGGESTTARLTAPAGKTTAAFSTGRRWDDENGSDSFTVDISSYTEAEWVLTTQSPAVNTDYFDFRVYNGSNVLDTYTVTPRWTIDTGGGGGGGSTFVPRRRIMIVQ